jgi:thiamine pyrophosphate-dependent acetolactate synthase large subunit-like protein
MTKKEAIRQILSFYKNDNPVVITSCGKTSREAWAVAKEIGMNIIPLTGSMGMAMSLSIGFAIANPCKDVVVIMGDGEFLMGFNAVLHIRSEYINNLKHFVLVDHEYESTGGQNNAWFGDIGGMVWEVYDNVHEELKLDESERYNKKILCLVTVETIKKVAPRIPDIELQKTVRGIK